MERTDAYLWDFGKIFHGNLYATLIGSQLASKLLWVLAQCRSYCQAAPRKITFSLTRLNI
jgi:hypothetical protein